MQDRDGRVLRVAALYPELMNIYADRGNMIFLQRRCEWRGIGFQFTAKGLGDELDGDAHDLYYIGGGQDRDQILCAEDLLRTGRDALHAAAARGAIVLGVCGGYQLLGRSYELEGRELEGIGLLDVRTIREAGPRLIGNVAIEARLGEDVLELVGFENHGGRTRLGMGQRPLGRVLRGYGNDGDSGFEGAVNGNTIGTYLHGPLLPKNPALADWLLARALDLPACSLAALEDAFTELAHEDGRRVAGLAG
ncbi:MAG TPA: glutamine amidotransferase [Solirubrobacteraceae bacterium]|nr:glutamine amidotransferase [Solirubrobacteraceae bacterium]